MVYSKQDSHFNEFTLRSKVLCIFFQLEEMWERKAYLEGRYPTAPLVNISGPGPYYHTVFPPKAGSQLERAGLVLHTTGMFWNLIRK